MNRQFIVRDGAFLWAPSKDSHAKGTRSKNAQSQAPVVLCLEGKNYSRAEVVPAGSLARWEQPGGSTAAYFVAEIMRHRFGDDQAQWPELAVEFCNSGAH